MWAGSPAGRSAGRLADISTRSSVRPAPGAAYGIVEEYGGHGIGTEMHQEPHVLNYGRPGRGPRLRRGWSWRSSRWSPWAPADRELDDDWTVVTDDGSVAAHFEAHGRAHRRRALGADRRRGRRPCRAGPGPDAVATRLPASTHRRALRFRWADGLRGR